MSVAADLREHGYALTDAAALGWPDPQDVEAAFSLVLVPDPRGLGKHHARDVIEYSSAGGTVQEAASIAFTGADGTVVDDFSRFRLLDTSFGRQVAGQVLWSLIPGEQAFPAGRLSADFFSYSAGADSPAHQDGFGAFVTIWALGRQGSGGESFLIRDGREVFTWALAPGEVLIFRDELFLHGVRAMTGPDARRDVLIFITVKP